MILITSALCGLVGAAAAFVFSSGTIRQLKNENTTLRKTLQDMSELEALNAETLSQMMQAAAISIHAQAKDEPTE